MATKRMPKLSKKTQDLVRGHVAITVAAGERDLDWTRAPGTAQVGWFDRIKPTLSKKDANATPPAFRDALIELARASRAGQVAA